ncbi:Lipopolysaccharide heptosyltransferase 1 [Amantichitinum ursilacus]|uniref:Lipopolysaccharide heptosyltransferase 1 n=2 Tax=Amantichitinum ursilacus TaxID=857265 RepID=A0A0N0XFU8_9NEIS|nr:Lipopolysaccharide heptosyltransferase 1 [Amantichitinum ursilacus]
MPPMPKILLVKLSSMGDIIHAMPAVTDMARALPGLRLDWVCEESFAALPRLHPAVRDVVPIAMRRWRKSFWRADTRADIGAALTGLRKQRYDMVLDVQGLIKSALVAQIAHGPVAGPDRSWAREPLAALMYRNKIPGVWDQPAIERVRQIASGALNYISPSAIDYGLPRPDVHLSWLPTTPYAVLLSATSREDKEWPEAHWVALGARLAQRGLACILPWGSAREQARAERLAAAIPNAVAAPRISLTEAATLLADARVVVGVDTGLAHLAAAMATPVVAIYCASDPTQTGVLATTYAVNLGAMGVVPSVDEVWQATQTGMRA